MDILSYILGKKAGGGGGEAVLVNKNIDANGTYNASSDSADGYKKVVVDVPNTYAAGDEGKVVSNGALVGQTSASYTSNGTYDTTLVNEVEVDVPSEPKDVNFYDYDGTLLYAFSAEDFANLSALPANPAHEGLTAQGWNWTLAGAKAFVSTYGGLDIGQLYNPSDGNGFLEVEIIDTTVPAKIIGYGKDTEIDWGDGSTTPATQNRSTYTHTYAATGSYIIKFIANGKTFWLSGSGDGNNTGLGDRDTFNPMVVKRVHVSENSSMPQEYNFIRMHDLEAISYPRNLVSPNGLQIGAIKSSLPFIVVPPTATGLNITDSSVKKVCLPETSNTIELKIAGSFIQKLYGSGGITFAQASSGKAAHLKDMIGLLVSALPQAVFQDVPLTGVNLKEGITTIGNSSLRGTLIRSITIPSTVTQIAPYAFNNVYNLKEMHLLPTTPPTLDNVNALTGYRSNLVIYVPFSADHSILNAYKTASNWSTFADYMQEEAQ